MYFIVIMHKLLHRLWYIMRPSVRKLEVGTFMHKVTVRADGLKNTVEGNYIIIIFRVYIQLIAVDF